MAQPFIGEIRMFAGSFPPNGWMFCDGALLPISENDALFVVLGTTYGGDGQETFALPDLRGRIPLHQGTSPANGQNFVIGESAGTESVTLSTQQIPIHTHPYFCSTGAGTNAADPANAVPSKSDLSQYSTAAPDTQMGTPPMTSDATGGSQPHENMAPFLCINYIISLFGLFPHQ